MPVQDRQPAAGGSHGGCWDWPILEMWRTNTVNAIDLLQSIVVLSYYDFDVCEPVVYGYHKGAKARRITKNKISVS